MAKTIPLSPKTILVRAPNWIGDQVIAYPFFFYLRRAFPEARIVSACVPWVRDLQFRDLVDEVIVIQPPQSSWLIGKFWQLGVKGSAVAKLGPWDLGFSLPNSFSAAWFLYRAGVKVRVGYSVDGRGVLLNHRLVWDSNPARHRAQAFVDLLPSEVRPKRPAREFFGVPPENDLDEGTLGEVGAFPAPTSWCIEKAPLAPPKGGAGSETDRYYILAPGATAESRRWDLENFKALARRVSAERGWTGVVVGGPKEEAMGRELQETAGAKICNYVGRASIPELQVLFKSAEFTICNESGLAHVASLCGSPVQIVCGAADPRRTRPLGPGRVEVAINPVECWPCERNVCLQPLDKRVQCLRGIHVDRVWESIQNGLLGNPPKASHGHEHRESGQIT